MDPFSPNIPSRIAGGFLRRWLRNFGEKLAEPFQKLRIDPHIPGTEFDPTPIGQVSGLKIFFFVLIAILLVLIIYVWIRSKEHDEHEQAFIENHFIKPRVENVRNERWQKVEKLFNSTSEADWRLAIIESDAMLEDMLMHMGYDGQSVAERLKQASPQSFPMLQQAWQAHHVRNRIAHDGLNYHLSHEEAWRVFKMFEGVFRSTQYV